MIYTTKMLFEKYKDLADPQGKIRRMCRDKELVKIVRGLYTDDVNASGYLFAQMICSPSYLSFDYALSYYNIIPERVYTYTSATFMKNKKKTFKNKFGQYDYRDVPKEAYTYEVKILDSGDYTFKIASKEKALLDKMYDINIIKNLDEMEYLVLNELRIESSELKKLELSVIRSLADKYHSGNVKLFSKYVEKIR